MDIRTFDRRIQFLVETPTQNSYGELVYQDSIVATVWAEVMPIGGRETFMASQIVPEAKFKIRTRYRSDLTTKHKVKFQSEIYDIAYIAEIGRRDGLELIVKTP